MEIRLNDLRESNEFLNILLDNINSAIFIVDKNINIQNVNNSFEVLFERDSGKILGKLLGNALCCSFAVEENKDCGTTQNCAKCSLRNSVLSSFLKKIPTNKQLLIREFYLNGKENLKYFQFSTRYIQYLGQEMVLIIVDDITEIEEKRIALKKQNEELKKINEEKNKILGIAAHDIRNPLAIVSSYAAFLNDDSINIDAELRNKFLKVIQERCDFGLELLNDILDFSKIESGEITLRKEETNFIKFLNKTIEANSVLMAKKGQILKFETDNHNLVAKIDQYKIEQVINNLLSNAMKYSPKDSLIKIEINSFNDMFQLSVIDSGPGVPQNEMDKLFKPFQTTSVTATNNEKSTGLGLAISKKIIDAHNGEIGVSNNMPKGAKFYFTLPL